LHCVKTLLRWLRGEKMRLSLKRWILNIRRTSIRVVCLLLARVNRRKLSWIRRLLLSCSRILICKLRVLLLSKVLILREKILLAWRKIWRLFLLKLDFLLELLLLLWLEWLKLLSFLRINELLLLLCLLRCLLVRR